MKFGNVSFGSVVINGNRYENDVVIDRGQIRKRKKKPPKQFRDNFGHTSLSVEEDIPWKCIRLVIGTGMYGRLPVMDEVKKEAESRIVDSGDEQGDRSLAQKSGRHQRNLARDLLKQSA